VNPKERSKEEKP